MLIYLLFVVGLIILVYGGDWLVKGAVGLAEHLTISPLIIGLTIVAFGTSAPELVISLKSALTGNPGVAVGNIVGSNIANVLLVLGVPAMIATIYCSSEDLKFTLYLLLATTALFCLELVMAPIGRLGGLLLLVCLTVFLSTQYITARRQNQDPDYMDDVGELPKSLGITIALLVVGLIALPLGASMAVNAAVDIARVWNVSDEVIGLTIVAIGTSLPELATGIMAARQGNASVGIGNVVGSNFFNIAAIMGITAVVAGDVPVGDNIVPFDMTVMAISTIFLAVVTLAGFAINRLLGAVLLVLYAAYLVATAML
ncbi:MAG: calcium/sodium antiporter [Pseudomonadota bacterium]